MIRLDRTQALHVLGDLIVPFLFILAIPIVAAFYISDRNTKDLLYKNQLSGCYRGNVLRQQLNLNGAVTKSFAQAAAQNSQVRADEFRLAGNMRQAVINEAAAREYEGYATAYRVIPLVDCRTTIQR